MLSDSAVATGVVTTRCGSGRVCLAGAVDAAANRKTTASANLSTRPSSSFVADARIDACSDTFPCALAPCDRPAARRAILPVASPLPSNWPAALLTASSAKLSP